MQKISESTSLDDLKFDLYKKYILTDIKEKFLRYKNLCVELAETNGKAIDFKNYWRQNSRRICSFL